MRYSYEIRHIPGKYLVAADTLSRNPLQTDPDKEMVDEIAAYVQGITLSLPASPNRLKQIQEKQKSDDTCQLLRNYIMHGWPSKSSVDTKCVNYWQHRNEIAAEGLLMRGSRIIIPASLQKEILESIHEGHQLPPNVELERESLSGGQDCLHN